MAQNFDWFFGETPSTTKTNNQSSYGGFFDDQNKPEEENERSYLVNVGAGAVDRSSELTSNFLQFINTVAKSGERQLAKRGLNPGFMPKEGGGYEFVRNMDPAKTESFLNPVIDALKTVSEKVDYDPDAGVSWEEYKDDWTNPQALASFVFEQGVKSIPDMAATLINLPAYISSRTQEIAETREVNKTYDPATNQFIDDPNGAVTFKDLVEALPTATAVAVAERFGAKSIFSPKAGDTLKKRVARGASREGATEFVQENIEYGGEVLGTPVDYDFKTGLDRGFAGLVAGAGIGGPLAAGDSLLRGNPLADAVARGRQDAQSKGGDGLDQAAEAAGTAASERLDRQRARMGLSTEPEVLMNPADLAGTTAENPIAVDGNTATINTASGTTTDSLSVPGTLRSRLEEDYPRAFAIPTVSVKDYLDGTKDFRTLGVPDLETLLDIYTIRTRRGAAPAPVIEPQPRQPLAPLGSPTNDPLQSLADTIILNERDMAAADAAGDFAGADALYEDIVRLRSAETALRRANTLAQNGDKEASDAIIARVMPVLQEEAGRRQAAMEPVQVQSEPLLLEDQGVIFAEGSTEPLNLPARVTKLKSNGTAYPTQKAAEAAMTRVSRGEPEYNWSVKRASGGFALEGNLPNTRAVNEKISPAVFEAATNRISQDFESAENRISQNAEDQRLMGQATELEAIAEGSSEVSISDQLAAYESELSETTAALNALQARLAAETKRDQRGVLVKNPIQRAMTIKDTDDLLLTIVKLGGINIEDASGNGFEPSLDNPKSNSVGAYRLFKKDGMTFDELREALQERGWYSQEDPNRPSVLGANEVMEDIREAVNLAQDNEFVYKGDKQAEIEFLKRDISFAEESLSELEGIVSSYKSQLSPEEAGRTDFIGITDSDVLNSINYFDEIQGAFNEDGAYSQEGSETAGGNSQTIDAGGVRGVEGGATGVQRIDEAVSEASSQARDGEARPQIQDRGLDPGGDTSAATETEPNGSVSRSGLPEIPAEITSSGREYENELLRKMVEKNGVEVSDPTYEGEDERWGFHSYKAKAKSGGVNFSIFYTVDNKGERTVNASNIVERIGELGYGVTVLSPTTGENLYSRQDIEEAYSEPKASADALSANQTEPNGSVSRSGPVFIPSPDADAPKSRETATTINPDEFLDLVTDLPENQVQIDSEKFIREQISKGEPLETPYLLFDLDDNGVATVTGHEGRHRARVLKEMGITEMPVRLRSTGRNEIRWSEQADSKNRDRLDVPWPTTLKPQKGSSGTAVAFPIADPLAAATENNFALESYTEGDITNLENRDIDALDRQEQNEREGENFALSGGDATVSTGSDRMQNTQGNDLFSQQPAQTDNSGRAKPGGEYGLNGEFYQGGQFMPASARTKKGEYKFELSDKPGSGRELIAPGAFAVPPPGKRSIYGSMLRVFTQPIRENGELTDQIEKNKNYSDEVIFNNSGLTADQLQTYMNAFNDGVRFVRREKGEVLSTEEGLNRLDEAVSERLGESDTAFSVRQGATRNIPIITDEELDTVFKRVTGKDRNDSNSIFVVPSYSDLPQDIRDRAERMGHPPSDVRGVFHRGSIYVVRNQIKGKNDFEQVLLHEATHGGFRDMLGDRGVNTALNKLFASMGGREGFEQTLIDLGIEADIKPYKDSLDKEGGSVDQRNAILLDEMLAFTGQKGSKGIKLRIQELIGAIRAWLAKNGYVNLSKTRASDIALMARRARENYFANSTDRNDTAFSLAQIKARAQKNDQGLYSNAEQTILDEGNKIFKASKKNPDASVRGDQILSFLKGRGIKKDELQYTRLEQFLTEPLLAEAITDPKNAKPRRYTQEEVIAYLRNAAPQFSEEGVDVVEGGVKQEIEWAESEVLEDTDYYTQIYENNIYEARNDDWEYGAADIVSKIMKDSPDEFMSMLVDQGINASDVGSVETIAKAFEDQDKSLYAALQENFDSEMEDAAWENARLDYMNNPVTETDAYFNNGRSYISIKGNEDYGYTVTIDGDMVSSEAIYDLDEAKVQAVNSLYEDGYLVDNGGTRFFDYLGIEWEDITNYREIKQQLLENSMTSDYKDYEGGHWDESNILYHALVTDRRWAAGDTFVIEELQSDWHNDIRKKGGAYDPVRRAAAKDALDRAEKIAQDASSELEQTIKSIRDSAALKYPNLRGEIRAQDVETYANYKAKNIFSKKGFEKIESIKSEEGQTPEFYNNEFLKAFMPGAIPELWFSAGDLEQTIEAEEEAGRFGIPNAGANPFTSEELSEARSLFTPEVLEAGRRREEMFKRGNMGDSGLDYRAVRSLLPISWWGELEGSGTYGELRRRENILELGIQDRLFGDNPEGIRNYLIEKELLDAAGNGVQAARGEIRQSEEAPPDSPFRDDRYLELAAKRAIIQAVSENKDAIAFSKADRVQRRWSANFDYEAIYNKKLRKIMDKTMGQTPQSLDTNGEIDDSTSEGFWSYEITPELREEIEYEGLPMFSLRPEEGSIRIPSKGETKIADKFIKGLQDKFLPIKRLQQSIEETKGRKLFEEEDAYLAEEMFYGKTEEDLRQIELEFVDPLMKDMESSGISVKELDDFLMAKHAPERNREVAKINPALPDGGSGLTTREANEHLASVAEDSQKLASLERLAGRVYEMTTLTRELLVNGGLISEEEVSSWDNKYEFYVPLKGFADNELNDQGFAIRTGKGYEIQGKESRRALGRRSKADSPLVQVISDLTEKTIRNRKNEVGQSLLTLAENNPDSMFWKVFTADNPDTKDTWNAQANRVVTGPVDMARDDRYFGVKRDGKAYYIRIEDERILDTMRKVGPQAQGALINMMGAATRWLSFVNTAANPQFVITNFLRDIQAAGINILAEQSKDGGRIEGEELAARAVNLKNVGGAVAAIAEYHRNKRTEPKAGNEYQQYYQEFMETGGKTGFFDSPDLDKIAKDLNGRLQESGTGKKVKEVGKNILDFVTDYNTAVENGIRLSTYVEARKVGLSAKKASSLAKNLTVNFNRKGDHGQVLNSAYMFFNAAVQGLAQFSVTMSPFQVDSKGDWKLQRKVNTAQKVAGGIVVSAAMLANVNRLVGGEDDDGEAYWDKVSPAIRERNIVFMKPDGSGEYYKFPLPYGYNFFYNLGDVLEGSVYGSARRKPKLMSQAIESFITAFSPMALHSADSLSERLFISATPSIAVPASELVTNTNFFGGDIKREPNPYGAQRAASHNYWSTTKGPYIAIAKFMNDTVGGGSSYKSGSVDPLGFMFDADVLDINTDVSPDTLEHLLEYSLGGIYRTGTGVAEAANRYFSGRENTAATVPFINKLVGRDTSDFSDRSNYYDIRQEITNARTEYRDSDNKREAVETHNGLHLLYRSTLQVDKRLATLREQEDRARDSKRLSARERDDKLLELREKMDDEIDRFYVKYRNHLSRRAEKQ